MTLTEETINILKNRSEEEIWNYVDALQHMQNALFQLEKDESNPAVLRELARRSLEVGKELHLILEILEEIIDD